MIPKIITVTGVAASDWLVLDRKQTGKLSLRVIPNGGTVTIQQTIGPDLGDLTADDIDSIASMVDLTANGSYDINGAVMAVRILQTVGAGTSTLKVLQAN